MGPCGREGRTLYVVNLAKNVKGRIDQRGKEGAGRRVGSGQEGERF